MNSISLPFSGSVDISRHHSALAAIDASTTRGRLTVAYLALLREVGPQGVIDHDAARMMGAPLSSICSIRNGCGDAVTPAEGYGMSPFGKKCTRWRRR